MKTVNRSLLNAWRMFDEGEFTHPVVVDHGNLWRWSGTAWVDTGPATDEDKAKYPIVVED